MPTTNVAAGNFLVPNATFIVELITFVAILWILAKFVIPRISGAMADRQVEIKNKYDELEQAQARAEAAEEDYKSQLVEARHDAARVREQAREEGASIVAEMREQAQTEANRILRHGQAQIEAERQQVVTQLRTEVGTMATTLAGKIIGEALDDDERQRRTVERFIADLESQTESSDTDSAAGDSSDSPSSDAESSQAQSSGGGQSSSGSSAVGSSPGQSS